LKTFAVVFLEIHSLPLGHKFKGIGFDAISSKASMKTATKQGWKVCSRGHKYRGSRCPYCWRKNKNKK
jgi:hypothetical protein